MRTVPSFIYRHSQLRCCCCFDGVGVRQCGWNALASVAGPRLVRKIVPDMAKMIEQLWSDELRARSRIVSPRAKFDSRQCRVHAPPMQSELPKRAKPLKPTGITPGGGLAHA